MSLLTTQQLGVMREGRALLHDINLHVAAGELHVLLGPNGAGKSTLLRALSGEWPAEHGHITLAGQPLHTLNAPAQARLRAVLPQHDALSFGFTVRELVALGRHSTDHRRPAHDAQIINAVLHATDTLHLAHRRYPGLSGGERRRSQLARVLAQVWDQPQALLLLDEPTHSLDLAHQHSVLQLLRRLTDQGFGVLVSLHDLNLAAAYAHRITLLHSGRMLASGRPDGVLNNDQLQALYGDALRFTVVMQQGTQQWLTLPVAPPAR